MHPFKKKKRSLCQREGGRGGEEGLGEREGEGERGREISSVCEKERRRPPTGTSNFFTRFLALSGHPATSGMSFVSDPRENRAPPIMHD